MKLRTALALLILSAAPCLSAQTIEMRSGPYTIYADGSTVTVDVAAGAIQEFKVTGPSRIQYTAKQVVLTLGDPGPNPPGPGPIPTPPGPTPPPVPAWGPLERIIVLYESSKLTGREPFYSQAVRDAMTAAVPKGADGVAMWRVWDVDLAPVEPGWAEAMTRVKGEHKPGPNPVLYAVDAQGRIKAIPMEGVDSDVAAAIKALGAE